MPSQWAEKLLNSVLPSEESKLVVIDWCTENVQCCESIIHWLFNCITAYVWKALLGTQRLTWYFSLRVISVMFLVVLWCFLKGRCMLVRNMSCLAITLLPRAWYYLNLWARGTPPSSLPHCPICITLVSLVCLDRFAQNTNSFNWLNLWSHVWYNLEIMHSLTVPCGISVCMWVVKVIGITRYLNAVDREDIMFLIKQKDI